MKIHRRDDDSGRSEGRTIAHINGRYSIINSILSIIGGLISGSGLTIAATIWVLNNTDYALPSSQETTQETTSEQEALVSLQESYSELEQQYSELEQQYAALKENALALENAYEDALAEIESMRQSAQSEPPAYSQPSEVTEQPSAAASSSQPSASPEPPAQTVTKLTSLPVLSKDDFLYNRVYNYKEDREDTKSNVGDIFETCITMRENGSIHYFIDSKYQSLTFTLCLAQETKYIDEGSSYLTIYSVEDNGNENLLYSSPAVTSGFTPRSVGPIDISGVKQLKITFYCEERIPRRPCIIIGDPELR